MPEQTPADQLGDMFIQPGICRICGAQVALTELHKAFHDALVEAFTNVNKAFEKAGFETRKQRAARRRATLRSCNSGGDRA